MGNSKYDAGIQIRNLGLARALSGTSNTRILDVGCGEEGQLVKTLLAMGFDAEGIDKEAEHRPFLLKQNITNIHPWRGKVPREDSSYDLLVSHHNPLLNEQYSCFGETYFLERIRKNRNDEENRTIPIEARAILEESLRLMKPDGKMIVYPGIDTIEEKEHGLLEDYDVRVVHQPLEVPFSKMECLTRVIEFGQVIAMEDCSDSLNYRTVIYGPHSSPLLKGYLEERGVKNG